MLKINHCHNTLYGQEANLVNGLTTNKLFFVFKRQKTVFHSFVICCDFGFCVERHFQFYPVITTPVTQTPDVTWILQYSNKKYSQYLLILIALFSLFSAAHALVMSNASPQTLFVFNETIYQAGLTHE